MKQCAYCKLNLSFDKFRRTPQTGRLVSYCLICERIVQNEIYNRNKSHPNYIAKRRNKDRQLRANSKRVRVTMIWHTSKNNARNRGIDHTVSRDMLYLLFEIQQWKCKHTQIPFDFTTGKGLMPFGPAIDRIDSTKPYQIDNIQLVCNVYNFAKNKFTHGDVLTFAQALLGQR